ncbi:MAG: heavy metal translocating P-type ATPase [Gammaproteobacteria bacterium]|nr:heavy metal translocating P-type ATPase [Gammaproteobacteria bacterium]
MSNTSTTSTDPSCFHCGQRITSHAIHSEVKQQTQMFCCQGCASVCQLIHQSKLEHFYQLAKQQPARSPATPKQTQLGFYDLDEVQAEFVPTLTDEREIQLLIADTHCAACVWLIERLLKNTKGVILAQLNLSQKRLKLKWHNSQIQLSQLMQILQDIGYSSVPYNPLDASKHYQQANRRLLFRLAFAGFCMMNLLWVSIALYSGADQSEFRHLFHWIGFLLATPTLLYSGYPFLRGAWKGLLRRQASMDLPIALGACTTYLYSVYVTLTQSTHADVYYDTVVNFLFVILVGRYLESISKRKALQSSQQLIDLQPRGATVLTEHGEQQTPIRAINIGDIILVKPGERLAIDGTVSHGQCHIDEAMLTGESRPVAKTEGDQVFAGTLCMDGAIQIRVSSTLQQTALGRIINLINDGQNCKPPIQHLTDRFVPWFVSIILALAMITFFWWWPTDLQTAIMAAASVLIITCPCAFGLATPMTIAVASGVAAREGILVKSASVFETLPKIRHFVFDKTGTLTQGKFRVEKIICNADISQPELLSWAAAVEAYAEHSIAKAIVNSARETGVMLEHLKVKQFHSQAGLGIRAEIDSTPICIGNLQWMQLNEITIDPLLHAQAQTQTANGNTVVYISLEQQHVGVIFVSDLLRPDALSSLAQLQVAGKKLEILSGDQTPVVAHIADRLGNIAFHAQMLPQQKEKHIRHLMKTGPGVVMFGDGVNDAPALARASIGVAFSSGTDLAGDSADVIFIQHELSQVNKLLEISQQSLRIIKQNIGISIIYNLITIPLAMMAYVSPLFAAIAMPISSLAVIANAGRLQNLFRKSNKLALVEDTSTNLLPTAPLNQSMEVQPWK